MGLGGQGVRGLRVRVNHLAACRLRLGCVEGKGTAKWACARVRVRDYGLGIRD